MNAAQLAALSTRRVWAMDVDYLHGMFNAARKSTNDKFIVPVGETPNSGPRVNTVGKIAVLPLHGVIEQRASIWMEWFGGCSTDRFGAMYQTLMDDPKIKGIVVDIDSPGGTVPGVMELSDMIYASRGRKPVVGVANSKSASAAYWIGSAFDQLYVTPSGGVGSVGVYSMHLDFSKALENEGIVPTLFAMPEFKAEFNGFSPLSDATKEHEMGEIDRIYGQFVSAVAKHRGTTAANVRQNYGKGRMVDAHAAVAAGMADKVATLEQVVSRMAAGRIKPGGHQAADWGSDLRIDDESWQLRNATERAKSRLRMERIIN